MPHLKPICPFKKKTPYCGTPTNQVKASTFMSANFSHFLEKTKTDECVRYRLKHPTSCNSLPEWVRLILFESHHNPLSSSTAARRIQLPVLLQGLGRMEHFSSPCITHRDGLHLIENESFFIRTVNDKGANLSFPHTKSVFILSWDLPCADARTY